MITNFPSKMSKFLAPVDPNGVESTSISSHVHLPASTTSHVNFDFDS